jgi:hypothetical protein
VFESGKHERLLRSRALIKVIENQDRLLHDYFDIREDFQLKGKGCSLSFSRRTKFLKLFMFDTQSSLKVKSFFSSLER